jgi:hypothetical protein
MGYNEKSIKLSQFITSDTSQVRIWVKDLSLLEDLSKFNSRTWAVENGRNTNQNFANINQVQFLHISSQSLSLHHLHHKYSLLVTLSP